MVGEVVRKRRGFLQRRQVEAEVLRMRSIGADGKPNHTLEEIGKQFGITRQAVQQIEVRAKGRLQSPGFQTSDEVHDVIHQNIDIKIHLTIHFPWMTEVFAPETESRKALCHVLADFQRLTKNLIEIGNSAIRSFDYGCPDFDSTAKNVLEVMGFLSERLGPNDAQTVLNIGEVLLRGEQTAISMRYHYKSGYGFINGLFFANIHRALEDEIHADKDSALKNPAKTLHNNIVRLLHSYVDNRMKMYDSILMQMPMGPKP